MAAVETITVEPTNTTQLPAAPVVLVAGERMPEGTFGPLTRTDFVRYAGAGGDFHPLHHDETFAQGAGLPSVFGMGLLHAGVLGVHLARWVGPDNLRTFSLRFSGIVWPGDMLTFTGRVESVDRVGLDTIAHLALAVTRQTGEQVLVGTATAVVV